ncbi:hypothetical protein BDA96_03G456800 [Sorghum bicolor]|uniref:Uncharacterized protein n=2 Tax=Sorghum bicolor TaxID=4558 RepID=A0A921UQL6_SORBI|nr:hypothetical protein BDA96_03G456800 [Sorghum bicolor]KXG34108.1 hypothetical protein SORBI_3003G424600 [Sorghum bicolor]
MMRCGNYIYPVASETHEDSQSRGRPRATRSPQDATRPTMDVPCGRPAGGGLAPAGTCMHAERDGGEMPCRRSPSVSNPTKSGTCIQSSSGMVYGCSSVARVSQRINVRSWR